jgi:DeoR/GlpR family transcriptional regulator of sugar metabolism
LLARQQGRGAIRRLARITGVSRNTIRRGLHELGQRVAPGRIRRPGGGRPAAEKKGAFSLPWIACCKTPSRATPSPA